MGTYEITMCVIYKDIWGNWDLDQMGRFVYYGLQFWYAMDVKI